MAENIQVIARVRGPGAIPENGDVEIEDNEFKVKGKKFDFNKIFGKDAELNTNEAIFTQMFPNFDAALHGVNGCVMAYGQTGSGKSHCTFGSEKDPGFVPRFIEHVFQQSGLTVWISVLEVYLEKLRDLLAVGDISTLKVVDHPHLGVQAVGAKENCVTTAQDAKKCILYAMQRRVVSETNMNPASSRSHVVVSMRFLNSNKEAAVLRFVDLAGSERASAQKNKDQEMQGKKINSSLSHLGLMILQLNQMQTKNIRATAKAGATAPGAAAGGAGADKQKERGLSWRASVLTFLLRDSLMGNSRSTLLATIRPEVGYADETISTLRFATQVKSIKTKVKVNSQKDIITKLKEEVQNLKKQLASKPGASDDILLNQQMMAQFLPPSEEEIHLQRKERDSALRKYGIHIMDEEPQEPFLFNISHDPLLTGVATYKLSSDSVNTFGCDTSCNFQIAGLGISPITCEIHWDPTQTNEKGETSLIITNPHKARVKVNGVEIEGESALAHGDRVIMGRAMALCLFVPKEDRSWMDEKHHLNNSSLRPGDGEHLDKFLTSSDHEACLTEDETHSFQHEYFCEFWCCAGTNPDQRLRLLRETTSKVEDANLLAEECNKQFHFQIQLLLGSHDPPLCITRIDDESATKGDEERSVVVPADTDRVRSTGSVMGFTKSVLPPNRKSKIQRKGLTDSNVREVLAPRKSQRKSAYDLVNAGDKLLHEEHEETDVMDCQPPHMMTFEEFNSIYNWLSDIHHKKFSPHAWDSQKEIKFRQTTAAETASSRWKRHKQNQNEGRQSLDIGKDRGNSVVLKEDVNLIRNTVSADGIRGRRVSMSDLHANLKERQEIIETSDLHPSEGLMPSKALEQYKDDSGKEFAESEELENHDGIANESSRLDKDSLTPPYGSEYRASSKNNEKSSNARSRQTTSDDEKVKTRGVNLSLKSKKSEDSRSGPDIDNTTDYDKGMNREGASSIDERLSDDKILKGGSKDLNSNVANGPYTPNGYFLDPEYDSKTKLSKCINPTAYRSVSPTQMYESEDEVGVPSTVRPFLMDNAKNLSGPPGSSFFLEPEDPRLNSPGSAYSRSRSRSRRSTSPALSTTEKTAKKPSPYGGYRSTGSEKPITCQPSNSTLPRSSSASGALGDVFVQANGPQSSSSNPPIFRITDKTGKPVVPNSINMKNTLLSARIQNQINSSRSTSPVRIVNGLNSLPSYSPSYPMSAPVRSRVYVASRCAPCPVPGCLYSNHPSTTIGERPDSGRSSLPISAIPGVRRDNNTPIFSGVNPNIGLGVPMRPRQRSCSVQSSIRSPTPTGRQTSPGLFNTPATPLPPQLGSGPHLDVDERMFLWKKIGPHYQNPSPLREQLAMGNQAQSRDNSKSPIRPLDASPNRQYATPPIVSRTLYPNLTSHIQSPGSRFHSIPNFPFLPNERF